MAPKFEKRTPLTPKKMRHVGFEIECFVQPYAHEEYEEDTFDGIWDDNKKHLAEVKDDGSLNPSPKRGISIEAVTEPLLQARGKAVRAICRNLRSKKRQGFVNKTCGGHIHVNANDFLIAAVGRDIKHEIFNSPEMVKNIACMLTLFEPALYAVTGKSRLSNSFCRPLVYNRTNSRNILERRYSSINMAALYSHGSIEFRCFAGSINPAKWLARAALAEGIVNNLEKLCKGTLDWKKLIKDSPFSTPEEVSALIHNDDRKVSVYKTLIANNGISIIKKAGKANKVSKKNMAQLLSDHQATWRSGLDE